MSGYFQRHPRRIWIAAVLVAAVAAGAWLGGPHVWASWQLRAARKDLARGHSASARTRLEYCQRTWPADTEVLLLLAQAARRSGDYEAAERWLIDCQTREGRPSEDSVLEYSMLRAESGDLDKIEDFLRALIGRGHAQAPLIMEALAKGYLRMYRFPDAMGCLDVWMEHEPDSAPAHVLRGRAWQQVSSFGRAATEYQKAVDVDPDHDEARLLLANAMIESGNTSDAIPQLERLRKKKPDDREVLVRLAYAWITQGQLEESRQVFGDLVAKHPRFPAALQGMGQLELQSERPAQAEPWFRKAVAESPFLRQAQYGLYLSLEKQGKDEESKKEHDRLKRLEQTIDRITAVSNGLIPKSPNDPALHHELGTLLAKIGQEEMAVRWYLSALRHDPDFKPAHQSLVDYYQAIHDEAKAQPHREALKKMGS